MFAADALEPLQKFRRRDEISAFPLNRLDENRGYVRRVAEALEEFVLTASPDRDAEVVRYFHRWTQRQQFLIEGTGAHHERLIHISPQPLTGWK